MGTDIHMEIEVKINGKWNWLGKHMPKGVRSPRYLDTDRNYNLFAILASVRNGIGFAGCDLGDGFVPISEPKGLPNDMDEELWKTHQSDPILGDHSFSWLTARELSEFDWNRKTKLRGVVNMEEYKTFLQNGEPYSFAGGVSGGGIVHVSNEEMDKLVKGEKEKEEDKEYVTTVEWEVSYKEAVGFDLFIQYSDLWWRVCDYDSGFTKDDVRIVFGFDS